MRPADRCSVKSGQHVKSAVFPAPFTQFGCKYFQSKAHIHHIILTTVQWSPALILYFDEV